MLVRPIAAPSLAAFVVALVWSSSAHAQETERSGVSFGVSWGGGGITDQGASIALGWRIGYALTSRVVLLGEVAGILWDDGDPPRSTASGVRWGTPTFLSLSAQFLVLQRLWVRPGFAIVEWRGARYTATAEGQRVTDLEGTVPALQLSVGVDAAAGKHNVFDITYSSYAFSRDHAFAYAGLLLLGYSYY